MKLTDIRISSANGQATERQYRRFSTLLALVTIFSLAIVAIRPAAAQTNETPAAPDATWNIKIVESLPYLNDLTDRTLRFDNNQDPHIAFGGEHLYYARWNPTAKNWFITTVDSNPKVGRYASLALDSAGNPRIAYYDEANGALKFAYSNNGGYNWNVPFTVDTIGPQMTAGPGTFEQALADEIKAHPEMARKLSLDGVAATNEPTAETGVGGYTSIATDKQNRVHISYYDWNQGLLMYARWDGLNWGFVQVDGDPSVGLNAGKFSSIAVDSSGLAHISYLEEKYDVLKYAYDTGSGWSSYEIEPRQAPNVRTGGYTSLVLDANGNPYISYQDWVNWSLKFTSPATGGTCTGSSCYVCGPDNTWTCRLIDNSAYTGMFTSIGLSDSGVLMISYHNAAYGYLEFASSANAGKTWSTDTVASGNDDGWFSSLAIDDFNDPGISHYSASTGLYSFVRWNGSSWANFGLVYAGKLGPFSSLGINSYNNPYISYFNDTGDQLKMAFSLGGAFIPQVVYNGGGSYSSIKLSKTGEPRIAFYDFQSLNYDLAYAYMSGGTWYFQIVDTEGDVGMYPSLALDANDRPYISYYDATNGNLKFAYWNGTAWVVQTADDSVDDVGHYSSLTLSKDPSSCFFTLPGTSVCPMISYYDATQPNFALRHAFISSINAWATQVVDSTTLGNPANVGSDSAITIDNAGNLHVSYYDYTNGWLKHATGTKGGSSWSWAPEIVDNAGNVGKYTSIAADAANNIHISYYDVTNADLKYIVKTGGVWGAPQVVDGNPATDTGVGSSLALFSNGLPGISYHDATNGSIKFATTYTGPMGSRTFLPLNFR